ncbi:MAG: hypothetical protein GX359_01570 [Clostridiales bacterium]|nr:hypothetical protein [Clostridiales bacterium]
MNKVDEARIFEIASVAATVDIGTVEGEMIFDEGIYVDPGMEMGMAEAKDPLLSSWPFVIGISGLVLIVSVGLGAFLARRKIKKGIDLYED